MSIVNISTSVDAMISFYNINDRDYYIGIGGKNAWDDENNPPNPTSDSVLSLDDTILLTPVEQFSMCKLVDSSSSSNVDLSSDNYVSYDNFIFKLVTEAEARSSNARYIYICAYLTYTQMLNAFSELSQNITIPNVFRKAALFSNPTKKNDNKINSTGILIPDGVSSSYTGTLSSLGTQKIYTQFSPVYMGSEKREKLAFMLQF